MASDTSLVFNLVARDQASEQLGSLKEKFAGAGAAIGAALGVGLGASIASAIDAEAANAKLAAQLALGPQEAAKVAAASSNVFKQGWGDSTATVNEAIKGVYQQIGDTSKAQGGLEGVTSKVLALSQTFDQDLGGVTKAVGQMLKTGLASNADEALDIITRGFQTGADKADDLLDTINEYGTQWRKFGLDGQTATGLISQGLKAGARDADLVADAIKEFSIRSIDGSTKTAAGFQAIGLNASDMAKKIGQGGKSATNALDETLDRLRGIKDPVKRSQVAVQLFGTQAEDLGDALYALDPSNAVQALGKVGGAADKAMKTISDSPAAQLEKFKRGVQSKLTEVGSSLINWGMEHKSVLVPVAAILGTVAVAVAAVQVATMVWTAATTAWAAAQTIATGVQWAWNAALAATPIVLIIIAVIALVAIIVLLWKKNEAFRNFIKAAWNVIWGAIKFVWDWLKANWPLLLGIITGPIGLAVLWVVKHWDTIRAATSAAWNAVWGFVKSIPRRIYNLFLNWTLPGLIIKHWSSIKDGTIRVAMATVRWVTGLPGRITGALASLGSKLYTAGRNAMNRFKDAQVAAALRAVDWVRGLPGRISRAVGSLGSLLYGKGQDVVLGLWNGIKSMGGWLRDTLTGWAANLVPGPIARALGIASPSKVMANVVGRWIPAGIVEGIVQGEPELEAKMSTLVKPERPGAPSMPIAAAPMSGRQPILIQFGTGQNKLADALLRELRKEVRVQGGNVQKVLGG
ncbi:phage tail tape measure protein [Actinacidiphila glaucinigra]|uniref:phage tail tape measure protein n=1 Tax=Actinacidiphila glaucinigra TaxID=235986 RepID=UPI002E37BA14|nr:phage tail tape measure protein [Actinacidiphila glaucinigra]